jgi:Subtilase family
VAADDEKQDAADALRDVPEEPPAADEPAAGREEPAADEPSRPARLRAALRAQPRKRLALIATVGAALIAAVIAAILLAGPGDPPPRALADAVPFDGRSPREPSGQGTRVIVALPRPSLGEAGIAEPADQRAYVRSLEEESAALRSALGARGIRLSGVVTYARTFNGFAATVRTGDLADLPSLGVTAQPVRRFYPAAAEPANVPGTRPPTAAAPLGGASIAVLDTGVDAAHPLLANRLDPGYDAVDRDDDPSPARDPRGGRQEASGTALAGILVAAGERVLPIRVAGLQPATQGSGLEDVAVSDQLLAGLERAVDPDGDGATDDHVPIAVVGVNSPYAGFDASPEARAIEGAADLGTLVVAPAGGEGDAAGAEGTIGSPATAPDALAVAALAALQAVAHVDLDVGGADARGAALLSGSPPPARMTTAGPVDATDPAELLAGDARSLRGRLVVVRAGDEPVPRAAAAAAAGARAVLLADPRDRPLPAIPAGRVAVPVLGATGPAAADVLDEEAGATVEVGDVEPGSPPIARLPASVSGTPGRDEAGADEAAGNETGADEAGGDAAAGSSDSSGGAAAESGTTTSLSPFSSRGPAAAGGVKPDVAAPGAALTAIPGNGGAVVGGSAVAAARAAIEAARLARERPSASPRELRAALIAGAEPDARLTTRGAGAGLVRQPPQAAEITARTTAAERADPCPGTTTCVRVVLANQGATEARLALAILPDRGTNATLARARVTIPPGGRREAEIAIGQTSEDGIAAGRLVARAEGGLPVLTHPFAVATRVSQPPPLGTLTLVREGGRTRGVRFSLGAFERGDPLGEGTRVQLTERLSLTLVEADGDRVVRRLTPPGGARELLPAEYSYTLPAGALRALDDGRYAFRAVARSPRGGEPARQRSQPFSP